jgi:hypothetical protein
MPTFEIPDGPTNIELQQTGDEKSPGPSTGSVVFNVTNKTTESRGGSLSVQVAGSAKKEWFAIEGDQVRTFAPGETQTVKINVSVPREIGPGDYPFRLRAAAENDTDNDFADGPVAAARKKKSGGGGGGVPWWVWLLIALVVLGAIGGGVWYFLTRPSEPGPVEPVVEENVVVPAESKVPKFVDQSVDAIAPDAGGYKIIKNEVANTGRPARIVFDQDPAADTKLPAGSKVILSYEPGVLVPEVPSGATFSSAPNALRSAGLEPGNFMCDPSSGRPGAQVGQVTAFDPPPKTRVAFNSKVNMRAVQSGPCITIFIPIEKIRLMERVSRTSRLHRPGG